MSKKDTNVSVKIKSVSDGGCVGGVNIPSTTKVIRVCATVGSPPPPPSGTTSGSKMA